MNKSGLAFVSTSRQTTFRTLVQVLLYGHVVHISSCSLVLVSRHERIATVGDFYMEDAMQDLMAQQCPLVLMARKHSFGQQATSLHH
jgi:hypothetical protein